MSEKRARGATRMRELGNRPVYVWLSPNEFALAREAAKRIGKPLATLVRYLALEGCQRVIENTKSAAELAAEAKRESNC